MCIEDIRIGRKSGVAITQVTLPSAGTLTKVCDANDYRTHIAIYSTNGRQGSIAPPPLVPAVGVGIQINEIYLDATVPYFISSEPLEFDIQTHGRAACLQWNGVATDGANVLLLVIETFYESNEPA